MIVLKCPVCGNITNEAIDGGCTKRCDDIFHGIEEENSFYLESLYIQFAENRIGTELMISKWQEYQFIGGEKYICAKNLVEVRDALATQIGASEHRKDFGEFYLQAKKALKILDEHI